MLLRRIVAIGIGLLMMLQTTAVFAGTFNDLKDSEWAETYIEKMASKGIITGFNGSYKPVDPVNKYSAVVMIYRTLKAAGKLDDAAVNAAVSKYSSVLAANKVPVWPDLHQGVAWMLENGVVQQEELKYFMSGESHINARRYELSIFVGKALNVFLKENVNTFISLDFKDANLISSSSAPYVNLLVNKKVLNGDLDGNFKPYDPMTRAAMAKVLSLSYDLIAGSGSTVNPPVVVPIAVDSSVIKNGIVSYVLTDSRKLIIADKTDPSKTEIFSVNTDAKIYINNVIATFDDLRKSMEVTLTMSADKVTKVTVGALGTDLKGSLKKIENMKGYYLITITDDADSKSKEFYTSNTFKTATLDGTQIDPIKLSEGDKLSLKFNDKNQIIQVDATTKSKKIEGILKSQVLFNGKPQIVVRTEGTTDVSLELGTSLTLRRNDKAVELSDIVAGDYVVIKTAYDKVVVIEAYSSATTKLKGSIEQIVIGRTQKLTVKDADGVIKEYDIAPTVALKLDGKNAEIYELRMNYRVEMELQGSTLIKIDATKVSYKDQVSGRVSKVYSDLNIITLKSITGSSEQYISVTVNGSTKIITASGANQSISNLEEGKSIFVYGNYFDSFFLAEKIIILD